MIKLDNAQSQIVASQRPPSHYTQNRETVGATKISHPFPFKWKTGRYGLSWITCSKTITTNNIFLTSEATWMIVSVVNHTKIWKMPKRTLKLQGFSNYWWGKSTSPVKKKRSTYYGCHSKWLHDTNYRMKAASKRYWVHYVGSIPLDSHDQICNALANNATTKPNRSIQDTLKTEFVINSMQKNFNNSTMIYNRRIYIPYKSMQQFSVLR